MELCLLVANFRSLAVQPNKALLQSKIAKNLVRFSLAAFAGSLGGLSPAASLADGSEKPENPCETVWVDVVELVRPYVPNSLSENRYLVFVGKDGQAYNCLDMNIGKEDLEAVSFVEAQIEKLDRQLQLNTDENARARYCSTSRGSLRGSYFVKLHLPYELEQLSDRSCALRLKATPPRIENYLTKDF
ncbi:hypothetical protein [uncultured Ruegeria sp.]|uniref:hypothetical protein n=1 Tax=uncultured Ruegeria sp. TaxID=259304 RepID=UPI00260B8302|nr:hypothetical protein [uncultured Ruegeria sp.]